MAVAVGRAAGRGGGDVVGPCGGGLGGGGYGEVGRGIYIRIIQKIFNRVGIRPRQAGRRCYYVGLLAATRDGGVGGAGALGWVGA